MARIGVGVGGLLAEDAAAGSGEAVSAAIAAHLGIGRSTLYRALTPDTTD